jgi:hypothetical protein
MLYLQTASSAFKERKSIPTPAGGGNRLNRIRAGLRGCLDLKGAIDCMHRCPARDGVDVVQSNLDVWL